MGVKPTERPRELTYLQQREASPGILLHGEILQHAARQFVLLVLRSGIIGRVNGNRCHTLLTSKGLSLYHTLEARVRQLTWSRSAAARVRQGARWRSVSMERSPCVIMCCPAQRDLGSVSKVEMAIFTPPVQRVVSL